VAIDYSLVTEYETIGRLYKERRNRSKQWDAAVEYAKATVEAILLHEMVHWGDWNFDNHQQDGGKAWDLGDAFELLAYRPREIKLELRKEGLLTRFKRAVA
jgi:hypothetical protein